ncbi:MAG: peptidylprolyl isomerase [Candidatus Eisenbacteria bacterium]|nr:peptidylprolyl isomerase [Candidatus Eisenbacteria bacterium]
METNIGRIVFKFFPKEAPVTVKSFEKLAKSGFYDGCTFHRVIPGFMIQGGDPNSKDDDRSNDGMGGPGYTVKAEFNWHKHTRGAVSMARSQDPNSAGSQFFIVQKDASHLDNQYTIFGDVIEGLDIVDKIANLKRDARDNPIERVVMQKVYVEWRPKK